MVGHLHDVVREYDVKEHELRQVLGFLAAVGRHPWRPAHLHVKLTHEGFRPLTTMLYFEGDPWLGDDTISSVKPELTVALAKHDGAGEIAARGLDRPFFTSGYDFALAPA
jgi:catechol 1,2-dioxygenase